MLLRRVPRPILRPFVQTLWATDESTPTEPCGELERVLPTGSMHLVFRLPGQPLEIFDDLNDYGGRTIGDAIVGGARSAFYVKDIAKPVVSVGAQLMPGASELLFGIPAYELAEGHTPLSDLWGNSVKAAQDRIFDNRSAVRRLDAFEELLAARLPRVHGLHPAVAHALEQFTETTDVRDVVKQTGYSHRGFIALFARAVGLTPKLYCRVMRFQKVLALSAKSPGSSLIDLALDAGYSDQSHFNRQFREFTGLTPGEYHASPPLHINHVPIHRLR